MKGGAFFIVFQVCRSDKEISSTTKNEVEKCAANK